MRCRALMQEAAAPAVQRTLQKMVAKYNCYRLK
jgi:hypothetical protein